MKQIISMIVSVGILSVSAYAGQILVGTGPNGSNGLTGVTLGQAAGGQYMASAANCIGAQLAQAGFSNCVAPVTPTALGTNQAGQRNYSVSLFAGAQPTSVQAGPNGETSGLLKTDANGITYAMINDQSTSCVTSNDGGCNYWAISGGQSMTIPIGVMGLSRVDAMLNDAWGVLGNQNTKVVLDFAETSNATIPTDSVAFLLTNGVEIRDAIECAEGSNGICTSFARNTASGAQFSANANNSTVTTQNVSSTGYSGNTNSFMAYFGTTGNLSLDTIAFTIPLADQGLWLTDIKIFNLGGTNINGDPNQSRTVLSAITLETAANPPESLATVTPEPGTYALIFGGLALLPVLRVRRKSKAL